MFLMTCLCVLQALLLWVSLFDALDPTSLTCSIQEARSCPRNPSKVSCEHGRAAHQSQGQWYCGQTCIQTSSSRIVATSRSTRIVDEPVEDVEANEGSTTTHFTIVDLETQQLVWLEGLDAVSVGCG